MADRREANDENWQAIDEYEMTSVSDKIAVTCFKSQRLSAYTVYACRVQLEIARRGRITVRATAEHQLHIFNREAA